MFRAVGYLINDEKNITDVSKRNILTQSAETRKSLIAGMIDGDGSIHYCNCQERKPYYYQISQHIRSSASRQHYDIMLFIQHLARSVGLGLTWTIRRVQL